MPYSNSQNTYCLNKTKTVPNVAIRLRTVFVVHRGLMNKKERRCMRDV